MVRMKVGNDQPCDRAIQPINYFCPGLTHGIIGKAGINYQPASAIA